MRILYTFIVCVLCASSAFSQQSSLLEKYRGMALDYNHDLRAADKSIASSIELVKAAQADLKPKLSGEAHFQYTAHPLELNVSMPQMDHPVSFGGRNTKYGGALTLMQPLYTGGRIRQSIRLAQHQHSAGVHQAELLRSSVCYQTDIQYWNTVARAELVQIAADYRASIAWLVKTIGERVDAGLVDPQDLLMAEVKLNEAQYELLQAQSAFDIGRMALNSLIGADLRAETMVEDSIPPVVLQDSMPLYGGHNRPELLMAQDQIRIAQSASKLVDSKYKPQLHVGIDGSYASPGHDFRADMDPNYAIYAKLSVPIFEWGKRRNEKRASTLKTGMANDNLLKTNDYVDMEIESARTSLSQSMEQASLTGSSLSMACQNEQKAQERYDEGKVSVVEVIEAKNYRQSSQINHVQAKAAAQGFYSDLRKALHGY